MSAGLLTAFLLLAGLATANPLGLVTGEGGGEAAGEAHGSYYADASGALDVADQTAGDARGQVIGHWYQANHVYDETKASARAAVDHVETPAAPQCACDELFGQLEQVGNAELAHADSVEKAADLETGIVDAGADVGAAAQAKAFFKDAFRGIGDAFKGLQGIFGVTDELPTHETKSAADELMNADAEVRNTVTSVLETDAELPSVDPSASGELGLSHATQLTSQVVGSGGIGLP